MPAVKEKKQYLCSACGAMQLRWAGKCPECGEWNTLEEVTVREPEKSRSSVAPVNTMSQPVSLPNVVKDDAPRLTLRMIELGRVLGGGIVPGSCVLVGGDPGIGKSTLLLQMAADVAQNAGVVLYVSAEESAHQIGRRATRLGIRDERLMVLSEIVVEAIIEHIEAVKPVLVIVDSVQAIYSGNGASAAGTVSQVRDCAAALLRVGKAQNIPIFLVGHVTKEGNIAGRACWSTWSTRCCSLRASVFTPSVSCVRSRIASAAPTKSAFSR